jgi:hypothetical protein
MPKKKVRTETIEVDADHLLAKVKEVIRERNVRRITIKNDDGKRLLVIPLTLGVVGASHAPAHNGTYACSILAYMGSQNRVS